MGHYPRPDQGSQTEGQLRAVDWSLRDERFQLGGAEPLAAQGIRFVQFPPVLNLQLKRFHFDMERMDMVCLPTCRKYEK